MLFLMSLIVIITVRVAVVTSRNDVLRMDGEPRVMEEVVITDAPKERLHTTWREMTDKLLPKLFEFLCCYLGNHRYL